MRDIVSTCNLDIEIYLLDHFNDFNILCLLLKTLYIDPQLQGYFLEGFNEISYFMCGLIYFSSSFS